MVHNSLPKGLALFRSDRSGLNRLPEVNSGNSCNNSCPLPRKGAFLMQHNTGWQGPDRRRLDCYTTKRNVRSAPGFHRYLINQRIPQQVSKSLQKREQHFTTVLRTGKNLKPPTPHSQLTEEEALQLADELSGKLSEGEIPKSDAESLKRMVAGLGDARGALRLTFAKSLGAVGDEALPILCKALRQHQNVIVRRASAKTLNLIGNKDALPYLLEAFLEDDDPVVLGSSAGAMATIGPDAMDSLLGILKNPDCTPFQVGLINLALSFIGAKAPEALLEGCRFRREHHNQSHDCPK